MNSSRDNMNYVCEKRKVLATKTFESAFCCLQRKHTIPRMCSRIYSRYGNFILWA